MTEIIKIINDDTRGTTKNTSIPANNNINKDGTKNSILSISSLVNLFELENAYGNMAF